MKGLTKTLGTAAAVLTATVLPLTAPAPAQASQEDCAEHLARHGYYDELFSTACELAVFGDTQTAMDILAAAEVPLDVALRAVYLAQQ